MANRRFAELADRYTLLVDDSRDGGSELARQYSVGGNRVCFLLLDQEGKEIDRIESYVKLEFDDELIERLDNFKMEFLESRKGLLEYLVSLVKPNDIPQSRLEELTAWLGDETYDVRESAGRELVRIGEPARAFLATFQPDDVEVRSRVQSILEVLGQRKKSIVHGGLDRDISFLVKHGQTHPALLRHLEEILPDHIDVEKAEAWWNENSHEYVWNAETGRFLHAFVNMHGIELHREIPVETLLPDSGVPHGRGYHHFTDIPENLLGLQYTMRDGYQGILHFRVFREQTVYLVMYGRDWGGGGNSSGGWKSELISREELEQQGWQEIGLLPVTEIYSGKSKEVPPWILFERTCRAGESFAIRNHKYQAPILIWNPDDP